MGLGKKKEEREKKEKRVRETPGAEVRHSSNRQTPRHRNSRKVRQGPKDPRQKVDKDKQVNLKALARNEPN